VSQELQYHIIGADGQTYGPASAADLQTWIAEGRVDQETRISRSDREGWLRAGDLAELSWPQSTPPPRPHPGAPPPAVPAFEPREPSVREPRMSFSVAGIYNGASWFFWLSGLSLVNYLLIIFHAQFQFVGCEAVTWAAVLSAETPIFHLVAAVGIGIWIPLGFYARQAHRWAFIVGILLLAADTVLPLVTRNFFGIAVHGWILYKLGVGLKEAWELRRAMHP
jgi:GYF domain 2